MDETIDAIVNEALRLVAVYGGDDRYAILEEAGRRLQSEGENALLMEHFEWKEEDDEQA